MRIVFKLKQIECSGLFVVVVRPSCISVLGCSENETTTRFFLDDLDFGNRTFVLYIVESLSCNGNDDARKQCSDWLNEEK